MYPLSCVSFLVLQTKGRRLILNKDCLLPSEAKLLEQEKQWVLIIVFNPTVSFVWHYGFLSKGPRVRKVSPVLHRWCPQVAGKMKFSKIKITRIKEKDGGETIEIHLGRMDGSYEVPYSTFRHIQHLQRGERPSKSRLSPVTMAQVVQSQ